MKKPLVLGAAVLFVALLGVYTWRWLGNFTESEAPEQLASAALDASRAGDRELATAKLADQATAEPDDRAKVQLRRVFRESEIPEVRATAMMGLAHGWDYESVDEIIDALADSSPLVRGRAGAAIQQLFGVDFYFRAHDPQPERDKAIAAIRDWWDKLRTSNKLKDWQRQVRQRP